MWRSRCCSGTWMQRHPRGDCDCDGNQTDALGVCGGCEEDANVNGICDADEIMGCTVPEACNYQESATMNDGSCDFYGCVVFGCTDASSCSYNPEATLDNGTCLTPEECDGEEVLGCTYENAENYVADATLDDGTCIFNCEHPVASTTTATSMEKWALRFDQPCGRSLVWNVRRTENRCFLIDKS